MICIRLLLIVLPMNRSPEVLLIFVLQHCNGDVTAFLWWLWAARAACRTAVQVHSAANAGERFCCQDSSAYPL